MTLRFSQADSLLLRETRDKSTLLQPRVLSTDGRGALPVDALVDPANAHLISILEEGEDVDLSAASFESSAVRLKSMGNIYEFFADTKPWSVTSPATDVLGFEVFQGDVGFSGDAANGNDRSEASAIDRLNYGDVIWEAWSFRLMPGDPIPYGFCAVGQWHGSDLPGFPRSPMSQFELGGNQFRVTSRSGASTTATGAFLVHFTDALPTRGVWGNYVRKTTFGLSGSLEVWRNGTKIVTYLGPLGYYNDVRGPYYKFGIYRNTSPLSIAVEYANVEWGLTDLSSRILSPLPISS